MLSRDRCLFVYLQLFLAPEPFTFPWRFKPLTKLTIVGTASSNHPRFAISLASSSSSRHEINGQLAGSGQLSRTGDFGSANPTPSRPGSNATRQ
ncbi:hypothetical protein BT67DRAFT_231734 [Trichocladium antarcticum]|uniref:Uncharacterized protein n=1 Tax=Trichocladium antarcticum TaxID=1450529 RepID=A0AAN6UNF3_9PEZI|nr:hypothetical protein BT67DRAFT_231734 [Trichocladium antarcticum]